MQLIDWNANGSFATVAQATESGLKFGNLISNVSFRAIALSANGDAYASVKENKDRQGE